MQCCAYLCGIDKCGDAMSDSDVFDHITCDVAICVITKITTMLQTALSNNTSCDVATYRCTLTTCDRPGENCKRGVPLVRLQLTSATA